MSASIESRPYTQQCIEAAGMLVVDDDLVERLITTPRQVYKPIGAVSLAGLEVMAGFKTRISLDGQIGRWAREAILADRVIQRYPETISAFPIFTIPIVDGNIGRIMARGLLTEDFTCDNRHPLQEYRRSYKGFRISEHEVESDLELKVLDSLDGIVYKEAFQHMAGIADAREVMIDFNDVHYASDADIEAYEAVGRKIAVDITER